MRLAAWPANSCHQSLSTPSYQTSTCPALGVAAVLFQTIGLTRQLAKLEEWHVVDGRCVVDHDVESARGALHAGYDDVCSRSIPPDALLAKIRTMDKLIRHSGGSQAMAPRRYQNFTYFGDCVVKVIWARPARFRRTERACSPGRWSC